MSDLVSGSTEPVSGTIPVPGEPYRRSIVPEFRSGHKSCPLCHRFRFSFDQTTEDSVIVYDLVICLSCGYEMRFRRLP